MKTIVAIPTLNAIHWIAPLVEHLLFADQVDEIWIYDNGCIDQTAEWVNHRRLTDKRVFLIDSPGIGLYDMWNVIVQKASELDEEVNLALLNSDIRLPQNAIHTLSTMMRESGYHIASVDPTRPAAYSQHMQHHNPNIMAAVPPDFEPYIVDAPPGTVVAWAFVIAAEFWKGQPFATHPSYQWWYGDDDLFKRAYARGGRVCRVMGVGCDHLGGSSDEYNPNKLEKIAKDTEIFNKMWLGVQ